MNLNDFGTDCRRTPNQQGYLPEARMSPREQWRVLKGDVFQPDGPTRLTLPAGAFDCRLNDHGVPQLVRKNLQVDDLLEFASSLPARILGEINVFWTLGERFQRHGYLHRRGYLLYGPQGCGKSSVIHQILHHVMGSGHVAVFCDHPTVFVRAMEAFRKIEPERPLLCVFEDIDAIIETHGDAVLLQWLDGSLQVNKVINIASTNYPECLDRRIVCRPRRFDRILKIEPPTTDVRRSYLARKLPELTPDQLDRCVRLSEGLSFGALAEVVISVNCLGNSLEETVATLRVIEEKPPSSKDFDQPGSMGFGARTNGASKHS